MNGNGEYTIQEGSSAALGATLTTEGVNFAVYSEHATRILLCLFSGADDDQEYLLPLPARTGHIWHGFVPGLKVGQKYGFRAEGPFDPASGDLYNSSKLLIDPYAYALSGQLQWNSAVFGYRRVPEFDWSIRDLRDSSPFVPKSIVVDLRYDWSGDRRPNIAASDLVIYETHVKGMTALHPEIDPARRGTYAGMADRVVIEHLLELGVNAVELLPVHAFVDEEFLVEAGLRNYWGYNSIGFFAPEPRYSSSLDPTDAINEFRAMVKTFHAAGIEVILDVVLNHTAEGGKDGPTISMRGLDNRVYYETDLGRRDRYLDHAGTGNTLNTEHPAVLRMTLDSLRHWVTEFHVDGFRFDLATALGREGDTYSTHAGFFRALFQDPVLTNVKLIAEPWDVGPGGYQVGHFPVGWTEWNDRFRDSVRSFWLGHSQTLGEFALRFTGSPDVYDRPGRGPLTSLNFVTCHDGFTLSDLVCYEQKHNQANHQANLDGTAHNLSRNFGEEGPTEDPEVCERRERARRSLLATVFLAHGVPMMLGGDELSRTQRGNNNAYCQDSPISWYDWNLSPDDQVFLAFARRILAIRASYPALRRRDYAIREEPTPRSLEEVSWLDSQGARIQPSAWSRESPRTLQLVVGTRPNGRSAGMVEELLILMNGDERDHPFNLPPAKGEWRFELDTSTPDGAASDVHPGASEIVVPGLTLKLARSTVT